MGVHSYCNELFVLLILCVEHVLTKMTLISIILQDNQTPLNRASYYGHDKVVVLLLEAGANPGPQTMVRTTVIL